MFENPAEERRGGDGAHTSVAVDLMAQDFIRLGKTSNEVYYGGYNMNGATLSGVVDTMNRIQGESS